MTRNELSQRMNQMQDNIRPIYLCHKCCGILQGKSDAPPNAYSCNCISGYVRDWQEPINPRNVIAEQIAKQRDRLALYERQGRDDNDRNLQFTIAWLENNDI